jgi:predicted metal-dependent hydrolase
MGLQVESLVLNSTSDAGAAVPVIIKRSDKRKTWSLAVRPGGEVILSVPQSMPSYKVEELLKKYEEWIQKRYRKYSQLTRIDLSQRWSDGQDFYYQGKNLKLSFARSSFSFVSVDEERLKVSLPDFKTTTVKRVVEDWIEEDSFKMASLYLQKWTPRFALKQTPPLKLRLLRRSWGQCRSDGRITLHKFLARLHPEFFEYVLVHELCHLFHMNHGPGFKALLGSHLPHWKEIKKKHEPIFF